MRCWMAVTMCRARTSNKAALPSLRHRIILNFEGEAEGASSERILEEILKAGR